MLWIVIILALIWLIRKWYKLDGFSTKPTAEQVTQYTSEMLTNKHVFSGGSIDDAKNVMPWIDPVSYEDARSLHRKNKLNAETIRGIFH